MIANYHTHTYRCHHATGTEEEYILHAIAAGVRTLGFSDHAPLILPPQADAVFINGSRMAPDRAADYFSTLSALREKYRAQIDIHIGFEVEYDPAILALSLPFYRNFPTEYLLLGQHFLRYRADCRIPLAQDMASRVREYVGLVCAGIRTGLFTYVAHPDFMIGCGIVRTEQFAPYVELLAPIITEAKAADIPLEYNLLGQAQGRVYPDRSFWKMVADAGAPTVIGCDAHSPERMANAREWEQAQRTLASLGIRPLDEIPLKDPFASPFWRNLSSKNLKNPEN